MRHFLLVVVVGCAAVVSCKSLAGWLNEPATGPVIELPGGATVTPPPESAPAPSVPVPGGGEVTYTPPPASTTPTKGETAVAVGSQAAGALWGPLGYLAIQLLGGIAGAAAAKKQKAA